MLDLQLAVRDAIDEDFVRAVPELEGEAGRAADCCRGGGEERGRDAARGWRWWSQGDDAEGGGGEEGRHFFVG